MDIALANVTVTIQESNGDDSSSSKSFLEVEVVSSVTIGAKETRIVRVKHFRELL